MWPFDLVDLNIGGQGNQRNSEYLNPAKALLP